MLMDLFTALGKKNLKKIKINIKITSTYRNLLMKEKASHVIRQYHYNSWPDVGSPSSGAGMIDLIGQVQRWQQQSGNKIVTVHCRY